MIRIIQVTILDTGPNLFQWIGRRVIIVTNYPAVRIRKVSYYWGRIVIVIVMSSKLKTKINMCCWMDNLEERRKNLYLGRKICCLIQ